MIETPDPQHILSTDTATTSPLARGLMQLASSQLPAILEVIFDGITAEDSTGQIVYANDTAARLLGYSTAPDLMAALGSGFSRPYELFDEAGRPFSTEELPGYLILQGQPSPARVIRFSVVATGAERWAVVKSRAILDEVGQIELVVTTYHDITELRQAELSQRLLAQTEALLFAPLDYQVRLANATRLVVPDLADWCAIDVVDPNGQLQRLGVAHRDPDKIRLVEELMRRNPPRPNDPAGLYAVLRTAQSQLYTDIPESLLTATIADPELLAFVRQLSLSSVMIVPMVAHDRTVGVITFAWAESGRHYGPLDLALAEELARRAALSLDTAMQYTEAQQLNVELERRVAERAAQIQTTNVRLLSEIAERRQAEEQVRLLNAQLEQRVAERTSQLERVNRDLNMEIAQRQQTSKILRALLRRTRELYRVSQAISTAHTPNEVLYALLSSTYLEAVSRASIALFDVPWRADDQPPQYCTILANWNKDDTAPDFLAQRLTLEEYGLVRPYSKENPIVMEDVKTMRAFPEHVRRRFKTLKTRSLIIFPLIAGGQWYGALSLHFGSRRTIEMDDLRHLRGLVDQTAIVLDNIRLLAAEAKARQEAEQANALKMKFLAMISHELRTPLTSIKGFSTTLLADDVQWQPSSQRDFLQTISDESDKLGDLIGQLLDLSRLEAGILRIVPMPQTIDHIVGTAMAQLRTVTANHQLVIEVGTDLPLVNADEQRIAQVLVNLVGNATKYSPRRSPITIAARHTAEWVRIDVSDQGSGIPASERGRVFEPFRQLDSQLINRTEGAGLGLAICKGLVEAHGGRIWVQDRSGPGTTISFTLPLSGKPA